MSEHDIHLKAEIRQLLWAMGFSTRVDVPMRAFVPPSKSKTNRGVEEYTDLDVLAVGMSPDFRLETVVADCKTSLKRATERMFWLRGLADFFGADNAYLVRAGDVPATVRQLAARLGISVVAPSDLAMLRRGHVADAPNLRALFDAKYISDYRTALIGLDKRLMGLLEYRQFDYWVYDEHLNLQQTVAHLSEAHKHLSPNNPAHRALLSDYAWLFTLALTRAVEHIRRAHVGDIDTALQEYLFGGQLGLREKERMAVILRRVTGRDDVNEGASGVLPPYYRPLLEIITRFVRRPQALMPALRYAEWLAETRVLRQMVPASEVFGDRYNPVAGKLLADVHGFLVSSAGLNVKFLDSVQALLEGVPPQSVPLGQEKGPTAQRITDDVENVADEVQDNARAKDLADVDESLAQATSSRDKKEPRNNTSQRRKPRRGMRAPDQEKLLDD